MGLQLPAQGAVSMGVWKVLRPWKVLMRLLGSLIGSDGIQQHILPIGFSKIGQPLSIATTFNQQR